MRTKPIALHTLSMNEFEWSLRYKKMAQYIDNTLRSNQTNITLTHLTYRAIVIFYLKMSMYFPKGPNL